MNKGNSTNDFVDRQNQNVPLIGDKYTKFFDWGSKWRVFDDSFDADQTLWIIKYLIKLFIRYNKKNILNLSI